MKKYILAALAASFLLAPAALTMSGLEAPLWANAGTPPSKTIPEDIDVVKTLGNIADWLFYILLGVAVLLIAIAGLQYALAQGDPEKIKKAGQSVLYALVGVVVASLAKGLVILVQYFPKK